MTGARVTVNTVRTHRMSHTVLPLHTETVQLNVVLFSFYRFWVMAREKRIGFTIMCGYLFIYFFIFTSVTEILPETVLRNTRIRYGKFFENKFYLYKICTPYFDFLNNKKTGKNTIFFLFVTADTILIRK